jgi:hypothetical protein
LRSRHGNEIAIRSVGTGTVVRRVPLQGGPGHGEGRPQLDGLGFLRDEYVWAKWRDSRFVGTGLIRLSDGESHPTRATDRLEGEEFLECMGCWAPAAWGFFVRSFTGEQLRTLDLDKPETGAYPLLAASGKRLVMHGTTTGTIDAFSTGTGARVGHAEASRKFGWNVAVSYDGDRVAVVLDDGAVEVWDLP